MKGVCICMVLCWSRSMWCSDACNLMWCVAGWARRKCAHDPSGCCCYSCNCRVIHIIPFSVIPTYIPAQLQPLCDQLLFNGCSNRGLQQTVLRELHNASCLRDEQDRACGVGVRRLVLHILHAVIDACGHMHTCMWRVDRYGMPCGDVYQQSTAL